MNDKDENMIAQVFCSDFPNPHDNPRIKKARALYQLVSESPPKARIVELGTQHGCGATALAFGLLNAGRKFDKVYTIDDYQPRKGWVGEAYGPEDKVIFLDKTMRSGSRSRIVLINRPVEAVLKSWKWPVGLLFWDFWGERLKDDFLEWDQFIIPGGIFAAHVPGDPPKWGATDVFDAAIETGRWEKYEDHPGGFVFTIRKVTE